MSAASVPFTLAGMGSTQKRRLRNRMAPEKLEWAREMRSAPTPSEAALWERLRLRRVAGLKFSRQARMRGYIADFYCPSLQLVVEVDGPIHGSRAQYDRRRDEALSGAGIATLRVTAASVMDQADAVVALIADVAKRRGELLASKP